MGRVAASREGRSSQPGSVQTHRTGSEATPTSVMVARRAGRPASADALCPTSTVEGERLIIDQKLRLASFPARRQRRGTQSLRTGRPAGPKMAHVLSSCSARWLRGRVSRGKNGCVALVSIHVSSLVIISVDTPMNGLQKTSSAPRLKTKLVFDRPPYSRPEDDRSPQRRPADN